MGEEERESAAEWPWVMLIKTETGRNLHNHTSLAVRGSRVGSGEWGVGSKKTLFSSELRERTAQRSVLPILYRPRSKCLTVSTISAGRNGLAM